MGVQNPNSTSCVHPDEPNLLNLHKAMEYDEYGIPHVRVRLGADNITITGNVNLVDNVRVNNTEAQSIPVYIRGNVIAVNQNSSPWIISANSSVNSNTNPIFVNFTNNSISVSGNVNATVSGTVALDSATLSALETINVKIVDSNGINNDLSHPVYVNVANEVEIKNDANNPLPISKDTSVNSTTNRIYVSMETDATIADSNYYMNVARGLVDSHQSVERSAYMPATPNEETSIWVEGGIYPFGTWTSPSVLYVASSSAVDTNLTIFIEGLDSNYNYVTANLTTNGTLSISGDTTIPHFTYGTNTGAWYQIDELLQGTQYVGDSERFIIRVYGGFFTDSGITEYIVDSRSSLQVSKIDYNGGVVGHTLKVYQTASAASTASADCFLVGIRTTSGSYYSIQGSAYETQHGKYCKWTNTTEPSASALWSDATPTINTASINALVPNIIYTFATVAAMQSASTLIDGAIYNTLGYYSRGDGGNASYYYISTNTTIPSDSGSFIYPAGVSGSMAGRFAWLKQRDVNVKQFGCKGDGSDDTSAFQGAIRSEAHV